MKSKLNKMSWTNRLILLSVLLVGLTNPWSVGYIGSGIDTAVVYFTLYANYVFVIGLVLMGLVNLWLVYQSREKVNVSSKHYKQETKNKNYKNSKIPLIED